MAVATTVPDPNDFSYADHSRVKEIIAGWR